MLDLIRFDKKLIFNYTNKNGNNIAYNFDLSTSERMLFEQLLNEKNEQIKLLREQINFLKEKKF
ncbi:MAG: hypothetical protein KA974_08925 [Saprospiraceae bacterium]|nr:hypothetical protein [Saprospiraceae bacterium]